MKKFLILLIAAITLPTALNSSSHKDLVIKKDSGNKYLIRGTTISLEDKFYKADFEKFYEKYLQDRFLIISSVERATLRNIISTLEGEDLSKYEYQRYNELLKATEKKIQGYKNEIRSQRKYFYKKQGEIYSGLHAQLVSFKFILEDVIGNKQEDNKKSYVLCPNPILYREKLVSYWMFNFKKFIDKDIVKSEDWRLIHKEICAKYSNFPNDPSAPKETDIISGELSNYNLRFFDGQQAKLSGYNFSGSNLWGADFIDADLSGADLSGADLRNAELTGANLSDADLSGADLSGAVLTVAKLSGADLSGADLSGVDLNGADLSNSNMKGAVIGLTNLNRYTSYDEELKGANLNFANLSGADMSGAALSGVTAINLYGCPISLPDEWVCEDRSLIQRR